MEISKEVLSKLSPEQRRALLARLVQKKEKASEKRAPLSVAQERIWFFHQLDPSDTINTIAPAIHLKGPLDPTLLLRAFRILVERHETLRTSFHDEQGKPYQLIHPSASIQMPLVDLTHLPPQERKPTVDALYVTNRAHTFDLGAAPLLRVVLCKLDAGEHILLLMLHHIISDGTSQTILIHELGACYRAFTQGTQPDLAPLELQYAEFARWQQQYLKSEALERQLDYWREQLAGAPTTLALPPLAVPPTEVTRQGSAIHYLTPEMTTRLEAWCQQQGVTPFMTLLALFEGLLYRLTGQDDQVTGTLVAARTRAGLERLIGVFINTLVLRTGFDATVDLQTAAQRVRETVLAGYQHQDLPFARLVEALQPERVTNQNPLFATLFQYLQDPTRYHVAFPAIQWTFYHPAVPATQADLLNLEAMPYGMGMRFKLTYQRGILDQSMATGLLDSYARLIEAALTAPTAPLIDLDLLPASAREAQLAWNQTAFAYPHQTAYHSEFERQVARTPDAIAVGYHGDDGRITQVDFQTLDRAANRLANLLRGLGVRTENVVGILTDRDIPFLEAQLGIFKAGAAYLPLDPNHPADRLARVLGKAQPTVLLAAPEYMVLARTAIEMAETRTTLADLHDLRNQPAPDEPTVDPGTGPDHLAYVIFTSGSTGMPKGAMLHHRGLFNQVYYKVHLTECQPGDRIGQTANQCFDISVWQFLTGPLLGFTTWIIPNEISADAARLAGVIDEDQLAVVELVPSQIRVLLEEAEKRGSGFEKLRWMMPTGEALPPELARRWLARFPQVPLLNAYGPTECSDDICYYKVTREPAAYLSNMPIGEPASNTRVFVTDPRLRLLPIGMPGECIAAGDGVGRGYLADPARTASVFVPNPLPDARPGERIYRTGDLVRLHTDENGQPTVLSFLGRIDHQVKLRGYRIELGEIEAALDSHPAVAQSIVLVRGKAPFEMLVAYLVGHPELEQLKTHIGGKLPPYMVPTHYLTLDDFPLTRNGKIDRRALLAMALPEQEARQITPPRTPLEHTLYKVWREVLGLEGKQAVPFGVHEDFFEVGGHSLLAGQVIARLREELELELPLRLMFEHPRIAELAAVLDEEEHATTELPPLTPQPRVDPMPLSFAQQRLWFLDRLEGGGAAYNIPAAFHIEGTIDTCLLHAQIAAIVTRHEVLRTRYLEGEAGPQQIVEEGVALPMKLVDLSQLPLETAQATAEHLAIDHAAQPFDLTAVPVLRALLLRLGPAQHRLLFNVHHIAADGWSLGVLVEELRDAYSAALAGGAHSLPPLPVQYRDYTLWQRGWLQGKWLEEQVAWWRSRLEDVPELLTLPTDYPRPEQVSYRGDRVPIRIDATTSKRLATLGKRLDATLYMVVLAAYGDFLARYSGQRDICVGTPIAGRESQNLWPSIGFFVNTLVMRLDLRRAEAGRLTLGQLLHRVRETAIETWTHQELPFDKLVDELEIPRNLDRTPLFQTLFVLQTAPMSEIRMQGARIQQLETVNTSAKFDLTLNLTERETGLAGTLEYSGDLFSRARAERMARHFTHLLRAWSEAEPEVALDTLAIIEDAERQQLLDGWNQTAVTPPARLYHQHVAHHAASQPEAPALIMGAEQLSYAELDARANLLARRLRRLGVGPEHAVGLLLPRSFAQVIALLAITRAGGACLTLDPVYPAERRASMLEDARATVLISQRPTLDIEPGTATLLDIAELDWHGEHDPIADQLHPLNPAYLVYTSGSTGKPKGVVMSHLVLTNLAAWMAVDLPEPGRTLQFSSLSFDVSFQEIAYTWTTGGALVLLDAETRTDAHALLALLTQQRVSHLFLPFVALQNLAEAARDAAEIPRHLRHVMTAGEQLQITAALQELLTRLPSLTLHNHYGPSETHAITSHTLTGPPREWPRLPPIGKPIHNTRTYVLDPSGQPTPIGVPGELLAAGLTLARGYLDRPALTAERFLPDPFGEPGSRMYRTGDLAVFDDQGALHFLGRIDFQVKIRGYRVEPGEVESALGRLEAVRQAVVVPRKEGGTTRLIGFVQGDPDLDTAQLREALAEDLPDYMIPAILIVLDQLPLTPSGKIDRKAVARLEVHEDTAETEGFAAPDTPLESELASIWGEALGRDTLSVNANFFSLGGDSISTTRVVALARRHGLKLSVQQIFKHPTVRELARTLVGDGQIEGEIRYQPFDLLEDYQRADLPAGLQDAYPLSTLQLEAVAGSLFGRGPEQNQEAASLDLRAHFDAAALRLAWQRTVDESDMLRASFALEHSGSPLLLIHEQVTASIDFEDLRHLDEASQQNLIDDWLSDDLRRPTEWTRAPLVRARVHRRAEDRFQLTFRLPLALLDGWSQATMRTRLLLHYAAILAGEAAPRPPEEQGYHRYLRLEQEAAGDARLSDFWQDQLRDLPRTSLPPSWTLATPLSEGDRTLEHGLGEERSRRLHQLADEQHMPLKAVLLAAHMVACAHLLETHEVVSGVWHNGRAETLETDGSMGLFLNILPLRLHLEQGSWRELIAQVWQADVALLPGRRFPLSRLEQLAGRSPLFDVGFSFAHFRVYRQADLSAVELLARRSVSFCRERLHVGFNVNIFDNVIRLDLMHGADLPAQRLGEVVALYERTLDALLADPEASIDLPEVQAHNRISLETDVEATSPANAYLHEAIAAMTGTYAATAGFPRDPVSRFALWRQLKARLGNVHDLTRIISGAETLDDLARQLEAAELRPLETPRPQPLSFSQERLWFLYRLEGPAPTYNLPFAQRFDGPIDAAALTGALYLLQQRHESLRTIFSERDGQPLAQVVPWQRQALPVIDMSGLDATSRLVAARALGAREGLKHFDLERGPLHRAMLLRLAPAEHVFLINMHHIISDGWSVEIMLRETAALYRGLVRRQPVHLPIQAASYGDFARGQRAQVAGEQLERLSQWWQEALLGAPLQLELPTDRPRPPLQDTRGATHFFQVPRPLVQRLEALARQERTTLFTVLYCAWAQLLMRRANVTDLLMGSPVTGRPGDSWQATIGFFVNMIVLRANFAYGQSSRQLVRNLRGQIGEAFAHDEMPFERLAELLNPDRSLSHSPIFQVAFALQNAGGFQAQPFDGVATSLVEEGQATSRFDLDFHLAENEHGLLGVFNYATALWDESTIAAWTGHFQNLLAALVAEPERPWEQLDLLDDSERETLLHALARGPEQAVAAPLAPQLLLSMLHQRAQAPALTHGANTLTYQELVTQAIRLAHLLRVQGVRPGDRVAVLLPRSDRLIIGWMACFLSGAAYVAIDPAYPAERAVYMVRDSQPRLLLTDEDVAHPEAELALPCLTLTALEAELARQPEHAPPLTYAAEADAYMIYTSGSTGQPKGVVISHRALRNLIGWHPEAYGLTGNQHAAQIAAPAFDATVWEVWPILSGGHHLDLIPEDLRTDPPALQRWLLDRAITFCFAPTALGEALMDLRWPERAPLHTVVVGGDKLTAVPQGLPFKLFNGYGPTENTVFTTQYLVPPGSSMPPIGCPLPGVKAYLLDRRMQPVPVGVSGEVLLGGEQLSRGYFAKPGLTAAVFVPDPFAAEPGQRLYRTGDLGAWDRDDQIRFRGRIDHQVQLRGFRIELGEIEAALDAIDGIQQNLVLMLTHGRDAHLVAFIVDEQPAADRIEAIKAALGKRLPAYMVPAIYHRLEALPMTANGKVDRRRLAHIARTESIHEPETLVPPRNEVEAAIAEIWREVLGKDEIGVTQNFFELGGHSLQGTRVMSRLTERLGVELPIRALFDQPTVAELAERVAGAEQVVQELTLDELDLISYSQKRMWHNYRQRGPAPTYNIPLSTQIDGPLDALVLEKAFELVIARHESLRTNIVHRNGQDLQIVREAEPFLLETIDIAGVGESQATELLIRDSLHIFDVEHEPLMKVMMLRVNARRHLLMVNFHHIITDGWSQNILLQELVLAYQAMQAGQEPSTVLPPVRLQYREHARRQRAELASPKIARQLTYWKEQLADIGEPVPLPYDRKTGDYPAGFGYTLKLELDEALCRQLDGLVVEMKASRYILLTAALAGMLAQVSGRGDIPIGSPIAGRNHADQEGTIGFFVDAIVLRTQPDPAMSFRELVQQTRDISLDAFANQDVPLPYVLEQIHGQKGHGLNPFNVMMALLNTPLATAKVAGVHFANYEFEVPLARYEIVFSLQDSGSTVGGELMFRADRFSKQRGQEILDYFFTILTQGLANPDQPIQDLLPSQRKIV